MIQSTPSVLYAGSVFVPPVPSTFGRGRVREPHDPVRMPVFSAGVIFLDSAVLLCLLLVPWALFMVVVNPV